MYTCDTFYLFYFNDMFLSVALKMSVKKWLFVHKVVQYFIPIRREVPTVSYKVEQLGSKSMCATRNW
jgi:hypothetical protein